MRSPKHHISHIERRLRTASDPGQTAGGSLPGRITSFCRILLVLAGITGLFSTSATTTAAQGVCDRTPQVRDELVDVTGVSTCGEVTAEHLAGLTRLSLSDDGIIILRAKDLRGLSSLQDLNLRNNRLTGLPTEIFDQLHSLRLLDLRDNNLALLRPGIFDEVLDTLGGSYVDRFRTRQGDLYLDSDLKAAISFVSPGQRNSEGDVVDVEVRLSRRLPVAVRVPYSISGSATVEDYTDLSPAPSDGLLFAAGEFSKFISLTITENDDIWQDTLVLSLGELSEIGLLRSDGAAPEAPHLEAETLLRSSSLHGVYTISIPGAGPDSPLRSFCDRTPQVQDRLLEIIGVSGCAEVTAEHLATVRSLDLSLSGIEALDEHDFRGLSSLRQLDLSGNQLTELPEDVFRGPSSLQTLDLDYNALTGLPEGIFRGLDSLEWLDLRFNHLAGLPEGIFHGLSTLQFLELGANKLPSLPEGLFHGLDSLQYLSLWNNALTRLPEEVFRGLANLEVLWLKDNQLTSLPQGIFRGLGNLRWLNLLVNKLTSLPTGIFDEVLATLGGPYTFAGENRQGELLLDPGLKPILAFASTEQSALEGDTVRVAVTLSQPLPLAVRVPYAVGGSATDDDYVGLRPSRDFGVLFLAGETTKEIAFDLVEDRGGQERTVTLTLPELPQIPLRLSDGTAPDPRYFDAPHLTAASFLDRPDESATHTVTIAVPGPGPGPGLRSLCDRTPQVRDKLFEIIGLSACQDVTAEHLASVSHLDLSGSGIEALDEHDFRGLSSLRQLDLSGNQLTVLPEEVFRGLANLEVLWLKDNQLTGLPQGIFRGLGNLRWLNLLVNNLTSLPTGIFDEVLATLGGPYTLGGENRQGELLLDPGLKPILAFASTEQSASEGDTARVGVTLSQPLPVAVRVPYSVGGSAMDDDFEGLKPSPDFGVLFLAGETAKEIAFDLVEDRGGQERTVTLTLGEFSQIGLRLSDGTAPDPRYFDAPHLTAASFLDRPDESATHTVTIDAPGPGDSRPEPAEAIFVPVILSSAGRNNSYFTSELTLTNRGSEPAILNYAYTAHPGGGSGTASDALGVGQQKVVPDAMEYLQNLGIPIPDAGNRIGTLRVEVSGASGVGVVVRTTTAVLEGGGRAGLAYPGIPQDGGFEEAVYLCGLRQNQQDRSNVAFQNMGASEEGPITLRTTVFSGDTGADPGFTLLKDVTLGPGEFHQYSRVLGDVSNGYVKVERVAGTAPFYAYGVINDQVNSDGSFVFPVTAGSLEGTAGQILPVILETSRFVSELTVTNFSEEARTLHFSFLADAIRTTDRTADFTLMPMRLEGGEQRILPDIVDQLRQQRVEGIGPTRGGYAGAVFATADGGDMSGIVIGARTGAPDEEGGQFGVFYHAVPAGGGFSQTAWIDALQQNEENRSNLALVNTGEVDASASVFAIDIYNGETGLLVDTVTTKPVPPRGWHQINGILGRSSPGTRQGYVRIRRISGQNPFLAYGVVNDGGAPGQRSGDGAYLPALERGPLD